MGFKKGDRHTLESKNKMRNAKLINPVWNKGKPAWNKGKPEEKRLRLKETQKRYRLRHPERRKMQRKVCNILRRKAGKLTIQTIQLVYEDNIKKFGTLTCCICLNPILFGKDSLEHKIPLSRGGTHEYNNLAIACKKCNSKKGIKTMDEYREWEKQQTQAPQGPV